MTLRLSACVEMIFRDLPFEERIERVARAGLPAFEFWRPSGKDVDAIARKQAETGLACAAFVGSGTASLVDPEQRAGFVAAVRESVALATKLRTRTLIVTTGQALEGVPRKSQRASIVSGLKAAAPIAGDAGVTLVLEPLNVLVDHKGYFLASSAEAFGILDEVGSPAVKLLYDIYHQQITEGNLISTITRNIGQIGHLHVADVPGRHEPGTGEINYRNVLAAVAESNYGGYVGLEYRPRGDHAATLATVQALAGV